MGKGVNMWHCNNGKQWENKINRKNIYRLARYYYEKSEKIDKLNSKEKE